MATMASQQAVILNSRLKDTALQIYDVPKDGNSMLASLCLASGRDLCEVASVRHELVSELSQNSLFYSHVFTDNQLPKVIADCGRVNVWIDFRCLLAYANLHRVGVVLHCRNVEGSDETHGVSRTFLPVRRFNEWASVFELDFVHVAWSDDVNLDHFNAVVNCPLIVARVYGMESSFISNQLKVDILEQLQDSPNLSYNPPPFFCIYDDDIFASRVAAGTPPVVLLDSIQSEVSLGYGSEAEVNSTCDLPGSEAGSLCELLDSWVQDPNEFNEVTDFSRFHKYHLEVSSRPTSRVSGVFCLSEEFDAAYSGRLSFFQDMVANLVTSGLLTATYIPLLRTLLNSRKQKVDAARAHNSVAGISKYAGYQERFYNFCVYYGLPSTLVTKRRLLQFIKSESTRFAIDFNSSTGVRTEIEGQSVGSSSLNSAANALVSLYEMQLTLFPGLEHPRSKSLSLEIKIVVLSANLVRRNEHYDRQRLFLDKCNTTHDALVRLCKATLGEESNLNPIQNWAQTLAARSTISRGAWTRAVQLSDTAYEVFYDEGPTPMEIVKLLKYDSKRDGAAKQSDVTVSGFARHKDALTCAVSAHGFQLMQLMQREEFTRLLTSNGFLDFTQWSQFYWFPGRSSLSKPMGDRTQRTAMARNMKKAGIVDTKVVHLLKVMGLVNCSDAGITEAECMRLSGTPDSCISRHYTNRQIPLRPVRVLSGFDPNDKQYYLPRAHIAVPNELQVQIFPFLEELFECIDENGSGIPGILSIKGFLNLLLQLRRILLQDSLILMKLMPGLLLWRMAPFNTPEYKRWAKAALEELNELSIRDPALDELRHQKAMETIAAALERYNLKLGLMDKWMVEIMAKLNLLHSDLKNQRDHGTTRPVPQQVSSTCSYEYSMVPLCDHRTVEQLYREYVDKIRPMNRKYKSAWRSGHASLHTKKKKIADCVISLISDDVNEASAIAIVQTLMDGTRKPSLDTLYTALCKRTFKAAVEAAKISTARVPSTCSSELSPPLSTSSDDVRVTSPRLVRTRVSTGVSDTGTQENVRDRATTRMPIPSTRPNKRARVQEDEDSSDDDILSGTSFSSVPYHNLPNFFSWEQNSCWIDSGCLLLLAGMSTCPILDRVYNHGRASLSDGVRTLLEIFYTLKNYGFLRNRVPTKILRTAELQFRDKICWSSTIKGEVQTSFKLLELVFSSRGSVNALGSSSDIELFGVKRSKVYTSCRCRRHVSPQELPVSGCITLLNPVHTGRSGSIGVVEALSVTEKSWETSTRCRRCDSITTCSVSVTQLPQIVILNIDSDSMGPFAPKNGSELVLDDYITLSGMSYSLIGFQILNSGHFVAYTRLSGVWFFYDDTLESGSFTPVNDVPRSHPGLSMAVYSK